jgi:hypothetical protein
MSAAVITPQVKALLKKDIKRTGSITPERKLVLAVVIGKRRTTQLEKELQAR